MSPFFRISLVTALFALITACGGSGSDTDQDVIQDTTTTTDVTPTDVAPTDLPPTEVTPIEVIDDVLQDTASDGVCVPDCTDKDCGSDGCGGFCGSVDGMCADADEFCLDNHCMAFCEDAMYPSSWSPAGVLADYYVPGTTATTDYAAMDQCFDYNGDMSPDNALASLAVLINGALTENKDLIPGILMEFVSVTDFANTTSFRLNALIGTPMETSRAAPEYWVYDGSYATDGLTCDPAVSFPQAKIEGGLLTAGPNSFSMAIPISGVPLSVTLRNERITATVTSGADGVTMEQGVLGGVLSRDEIEVALARVNAYCDSLEPEAPDWCTYMSSVEALLPDLYDLDLNDDCPPNATVSEAKACMDALSLCVYFKLDPIVITDHKSMFPED